MQNFAQKRICQGLIFRDQDKDFNLILKESWQRPGQGLTSLIVIVVIAALATVDFVYSFSTHALDIIFDVASLKVSLQLVWTQLWMLNCELCRRWSESGINTTVCWVSHWRWHQVE